MVEGGEESERGGGDGGAGRERGRKKASKHNTVLNQKSRDSLYTRTTFFFCVSIILFIISSFTISFKMFFQII